LIIVKLKKKKRTENVLKVISLKYRGECLCVLWGKKRSGNMCMWEK